MGSIMTYLASMQDGPVSRYHFKLVETRGGGHALLSLFHMIIAAGHIGGAAISGRLALVHLNLAEGGSVYRKGFLLAVARLIGARVLLHLHAAQIRKVHAPVNGIGRAVLRWMFRAADHSVVLGEVWREWVINELGVPPAQVSIVYNGVPNAGSRRRPEKTDAAFHLLFAGNLSERKGVSDLLQALSLPSVRQRAIKVTLVGGGPVKHYRRLAEQLGIADRTLFTGWVNHETVRDMMLRADALILPSYDEGLPLVILEALALGTPVICTPVGSVPEVLRHGKTALFVTPGLIPDIADAITNLIDNVDLQRSLSRAGSDLYDRAFTLAAFARSIADLYALVHADRVHCPFAWSPVREAEGDAGN